MAVLIPAGDSGRLNSNVKHAGFNAAVAAGVPLEIDPSATITIYEETDELSRWLTANGVRVVNSRLSFAAAIPPIRWRMKTLTGICKMDIPRAAHALAPELASRGLEV